MFQKFGQELREDLLQELTTRQESGRTQPTAGHDLNDNNDDQDDDDSGKKANDVKANQSTTLQTKLLQQSISPKPSSSNPLPLVAVAPSLFINIRYHIHAFSLAMGSLYCSTSL
jgi:hypothetical protein